MTSFGQDIVGYNLRMTDINASIGIEQLKKLPTFNKKRNENANFFNSNLCSELISLPKTHHHIYHVYHQYVVNVKSLRRRDELLKRLNEFGIGARVYYHTILPDLSINRSLGYYNNCPIARKVSKEVLSLPVSPQLTEDQLSWIVDKFNQILVK